MKRLIVLLLALLLVLALPACGGKKDKAETKTKEENPTEQTAEETETEEKKTVDFGSLPIDLEGNDNQQIDDGSGTDSPKPSEGSTTPSPGDPDLDVSDIPILGGNGDGVVETPLIPFN